MDKQDGTDMIDTELMDEMCVPDGCETEAYLADLEGLDLSEAQKRATIHTLWKLMEDLVRLKFGLDPITALELAKRANDLALMVSSEGVLSDNTEPQALPKREADKESE